MFRKSAIAILLCMAMLVSAFAPAVYADTIVEIDTSGLWGTDIPGDDTTGDDNSGDQGSGDDSSDDNSTYIPDDNVTYIPEDNVDTGNNNNNNNNDDDDDDDRNVTITTTPSTGNGGNTTVTKPDDTTETTPEPEVTTPVITVNFTDVKKTDWFYNDVGTLAGMGVINGYLDGSFKPQNNVTRAEFVKLLVSLIAGDNTYVTYDKIFDDVEVNAWYSEYITTAIVFGIIDANDYGANFKPDQPITRREVAKLVANSITIEVGGYRTPFADTADHNIIALYRYGIMQGNVDPSTGYRYFYPDTQITRAETAAVILRLYKLVEGGEDYVEQFMKENNLPPLQALYLPTTQNDFYNVLTNAWDNNQAFLVYNYNFGAGSEQMRVLSEQLQDAYNTALMFRPEISTYVSLKMITKSDGVTTELTLEFDSGMDGKTYEGLVSEKEAAEAKAAEIASQLFTGNETGLEKADMVHDYIMGILEYDFSYSTASHTAYGALSTGKAVCQGYSALFNMICHAAGVNSLAVANDSHMWNVVYAGGKIYHYDVTTSDINKHYVSRFKGVEEADFIKDTNHAGYTLPGADYFS